MGVNKTALKGQYHSNDESSKKVCASSLLWGGRGTRDGGRRTE